MKTNYTSKELPHIFVNLSPEEMNTREGKCPANESFWEGGYFSYSTCIARWLTHKGKRALLINDTHYSNSTSGHQSGIARAIPPGILTLHVDGVGCGNRLWQTDGLPLKLYQHALERSMHCEEAASKARSAGNKGAWAAKAQVWIERAQAVSDFFGLRRKVNAGTVERVRKAAAAAELKAEKERAERGRKAAERMAAEREKQGGAFERWKLNMRMEGDHFNPGLFPVAFRVESGYTDGPGGEGYRMPELVSTLGARVPLDAARVALRFILRKRGREWRRNGETCSVGHYQIDAINPQGVIAGCHRFGWDEVERLAGLLQETGVEA